MEIHDKKIYYHGGSLKNPIFKWGGGGGGGGGRGLQIDDI